MTTHTCMYYIHSFTCYCIHIYNKLTVYSRLYLKPFELKIRQEPYVPTTVVVWKVK